MRFEWDKAKDERNRRERGFGLDIAEFVLADPAVVIEPDIRRPYGEPRWRAFGRIEGRLFVVVYTVREDVCRVISARKANRREQHRHGHGQSAH